MPSPDAADHRTERVFAHADALGRARAAETARASALIKDFVAQAIAAGIAPSQLKARSLSAGASYRTGIQGWYLRKDRTVGVSTEGLFYVLATPATFSARFSGVALIPRDPPMELGRGARDGESMPLPTALKRRLDAGNDFPT